MSKQLAVILPAAGASSRFGAGRNKLLEDLGGQTVVARSVSAFLNCPNVAMVVVATASPAVREALAGLSTDELRFCEGGPSRAHSVSNALSIVPLEIEWVAVHDAARPLVCRDLISRTFAAARQHGAAVPAQPVSLTIKQADGPLPARVKRTVPRHDLWAMQTPQIMQRQALAQAFDTCPIPLDQVTDDAQLIELAGQEVWLIPGDDQNLKITTAPDLEQARLLLKNNQT